MGLLVYRSVRYGRRFSTGKVNAGIHVIVWDIRLPYALMALLVGMALG